MRKKDGKKKKKSKEIKLFKKSPNSQDLEQVSIYFLYNFLRCKNSLWAMDNKRNNIYRFVNEDLTHAMILIRYQFPYKFLSYRNITKIICILVAMESLESYG